MEQNDIMQARKERILAYIKSDEYIPMKRRDLRVMIDVRQADRPLVEELLQQLREGGADGIVCVMSGDFVQRGEFAVADKFARAEMAVRCGADLVLELPVTAALSSAEGFAAEGVEAVFDESLNFDRVGVQGGDSGFAAL